PNANFNGTDSFTYTITSGGVTETATVTVTVTAVNDAPVLSTNTGSTASEGGTDSITASELAVTDVDNSAAQLTYVIGSGPAYGRLELTTAPGVSASTFTQADIAANRLVYIHDGSETTSDNFTFTVSDGAGGSLGATTMTLTITPVNDAPTIISNGGGPTTSINIVENVSAVTIVTGADVDLPAQTLTYSISGGVDQARFTINAATGALNFTAPPDFEVATDANGDNVYVVQVQVIDSQGASTIQTIQVTVTDVAEGLPPTQTTPPIPPVLLPTTPPPPTGPDPEPPSPPNSSEPPTDASLPSPGSQGPRSAPSDFQAVNAASVSSAPVAERIISLRDELGKLVDIGRDQAGFIPHDDTRRPAFTVLPVEPVPVLEPEPVEKQPSTSELLLTKLSEMAGSLEQAIGVSEEHHELVTRVAALTGTTLSAGFIVWALRSGALLASFMATMPAWRHFDPLPVLGGTRSEWERRRKDNERDQKAEAAEYRGLKKLLG
ncbi:MAG: Ig-like domain-containing protein, partial [Nitrospira sp.]|nr:Ig-like domain-containing protein [Nitrospira sp.]